MMVFLAVVEYGSFTIAADVICLPKSNVSRKVSRLEKNLGVILLERSTRSLHLTEIGQIYFEHCVRINEEIKSASYCVEAMTMIPRGKLNLCTSVTIGQTMLAPLLPEFNEKYPDVTLDLRLTNRRVDLIEEGLDLVIRVGESSDSSLISRKLATSNLHLYANPTYLKQNTQIVEPNDLSDHKCLFMSAVNKKPRWELVQDNAKSYVDITPAFVSDDFNIVYQMAVAGSGVALLPEYLCKQAENDKRLVRVLDCWVGRSVSLYAIYPSKRGVTPKVRAMLDYLIDKF